MIPDESLSDNPVLGQWLSPDDKGYAPLEDWELGGVALFDVSQGLQYQAWKLVLEGNDLVVYPQVTGPRQVIYTVEDGSRVDAIALSFDQNMNWTALVYTDDTKETFHYWYDSSTPGYRISVYTDMISARLTLDDKRPEQLRTGGTDVLLAYLKVNPETDGMALWYRQQRDRYGVEYLLGDFPTATSLGRVGMNSVGRVQFELYSN